MAFSTHHQLQNKDFWLKLRVDKQILELKRQLAAKEGKNERFVLTCVCMRANWRMQTTCTAKLFFGQLG